MLNDVSGIKLKGGSFENLTDLNILDPRDGNKVKRVKGAIVYGRNGAGKSTVAKALKKVILGGYTDIIDANVFDKDGTIINLSEDEKKHIFVFDEEFVDANVKLQDTGLNTIVMLGQQVELADKITDAQNELHIAKQQYIDQENIIRNVFENRDNSKSPKFYQMKLKLALQGDDCWAGRDKIVRNGRSNTGVKDDTYKKFINLAPQKSRDELIILFDKKLLDFVKLGNVVDDCIQVIDSVNTGIRENNDKIKRKIENPYLPIFIGKTKVNIIRQVLEAFSTFQYKKNIEKISTDSFILNDIPKQYRTYFNNLMYRLVLHGGSHREEQVKALDDLNFFSVISSEEKIRTAKDVLCYLYILNAKHVLSHLKDSGNNVKSNLERWCSDIENMSVA